ncbi:MAG TPA: cation:proton antiporter [Candidatus Sulfotelmatobacter sp.]|nr:cation:proton antiporter [Candidatus Sulfotelmatobacter sp.]
MTHADLLPVLLALVLVLLGARLGGAAFEAIGQPAVLGELLIGVVIGNLGLIGFHQFDRLAHQPSLELLAEIGVLFLLFQVGLESNVRDMLAVGASSFLVATFGVIVPMVLGFFVSREFFPASPGLAHWFIGAILCATSVGITARVLGDLGRTASREGRIILGAAVIDDVLGLIVLAVISGAIQAANGGAAFRISALAWIVGKAVAFLVAAVLIGGWLSRRVFRVASHLRGQGVLLSLALAFCFALSWLAAKAGLAPIVGAFAAGLVLEPVNYQELMARDRHRREIRELIEPLASFLVPVFFVLMGMRVDLSRFAHREILGFAAVLTLAAIAGKQACSLGVLERGLDRLSVGLGMIPRGEVGLIFASIGASLSLDGGKVVSPAVYSAVVLMISLTTLLTPPLLTARFRESDARAAARR